MQGCDEFGECLLAEVQVETIREGEGVFRRAVSYSPDVHGVTSGEVIVTIFSSLGISSYERSLFLLVSFWQLWP